MTNNSIFDIALFAGIEDYSPVYSVFWETNSAFPDIPMNEKKAKFRAALFALIKEELIQLCVDTNPSGREGIHFYTKNQAIDLIMNESIFEPKSNYADNLCISTTSKGEDVFLKKDYAHLE